MIGVLRDLRDATGAVVFGGIVVGAAVVVVGGLTWGGIEISNAVSNSTAKSSGDAQVKRDTNSGANQEQASATFHQLYTQIQGYEGQLEQAKAAGQSGTDMLALEQTCDQAVQQYNADAITLTMAPYLPSGYPTSVNQSVCNG